MLITVDKLASRYSLLPSEVLERGNTFDLYVMDIGIRYEYVQQQKRNGTYKKTTPELSETQMAEMLKKTRGAK